MNDSLFAYDEAIFGRFPSIRAGVVHAVGLTNGPSGADLVSAYREEQRAVTERVGTASLGQLPSMTAWRRAFSQFGVKPTQYRNAAEALLRRLTKHGEIPSINTVVDIGNLVSIRYAMPVAVVDVAGIAGGITVRFAHGHEDFIDLVSTDLTHPEPGEVVFVDSNDTVCARRWCWRQSAQTATGPATTEALMVVEGHHDSASPEIDSALEDLVRLLATFQVQARTTSAILSPAHPRLLPRPP